jgi:hypothetical protein
MPDKRTPCGNTCIRCWRNRLKHGNEKAKAYLKAHPELNGFKVHGPSDQYPGLIDSSVLEEQETKDLFIEFDKDDTVRNILIKIQNELRTPLAPRYFLTLHDKKLDNEDVRIQKLGVTVNTVFNFSKDDTEYTVRFETE